MREVFLGDICKIKSSKRIFESEYVRNGVAFIRGQEISDKTIGKDGVSYECYISSERYEELKKSYGVPQIGDILITAVGTIGNLCYVDFDTPFYFKDGNVIWFTDFSETVDSQYLYYFMQSPYFKKQLENALIGAVQKALTMVMLKDVHFELPPIDIQKAIVKIMNNIDNKINLNNSICSDLESFAKTIYDYWFLQFEFPNEDGKPYKSSGGKMVWNEELKREIPEGWTVKHLKDHQLIVGGTPSRKEKKCWDGTIPWLTTSEINNGIISRPKEYITDYGLANSAAKMVNKDSLIVAMYGLGTAGRIGYLPYASTTNQACCSITCKNEFELGYLYFFLKSQQPYIDTIVTGSIQKNLSKDKIGDFAYLYPNIELLEKADFKLYLDTMVSVTKENQELASLRDFLLPLLMNGQVTFKD